MKRLPPPITVSERAIEAAWDTPDDVARLVLEQAHGTIVKLSARIKHERVDHREQRLRLEERCINLARSLERAEAELEGYRSRDQGALS